MDIPIIPRHEVICFMKRSNTMLSTCRLCKFHRYETVDGYVVCDYDPAKDGPKKVNPERRPKF